MGIVPGNTGLPLGGDNNVDLSLSYLHLLGCHQEVHSGRALVHISLSGGVLKPKNLTFVRPSTGKIDSNNCSTNCFALYI